MRRPSSAPSRELSARRPWVVVLGVVAVVGLLPFTSGTARVPSAPLAPSGTTAVPLAFEPAPSSLPPTPAATVNPKMHYTAQPAPMGVADFGVGASDQPYTYNTSGFRANFSWQSLDYEENYSTDITVQLNAVLVFANGATTYDYWIQDVALLDTVTGSLSFEDNVWNFTTSATCLAASAVSGNGSVYPLTGCEGYYAYVASGQTGAVRDMPTPGNFSLQIRSYLGPGGVPAVVFSYWDGVSTGPVPYDNVLWPWATGLTSDSGFVVNGSAYTPNDLFYDAEAVLGGPGNGATNRALDLTHSELTLLYWNGHNFQAPRSTWDFGADTGETVSGVLNTYVPTTSGTPALVQRNTTHGSTLAQVYVQSGVGYLNVSIPSSTGGTLSVAGTLWPFTGDWANVTLAPSTYTVWVNTSAESEDLGSCTVTGGATTHVTVGSGCTPTAEAPVAEPASVDLGETTVVHTVLMSSGSGEDSYSWTVNPATGLGCSASTSNVTDCDPTTPGVYTIEVTVTDSDAQSTTSPSLTVFVYPDPTVTVGASRAVLDVGQLWVVTASASGGSGGYTYAWSGLPPGCGTPTAAAFGCTPTSTGASTVQVVLKDSDGWAVTASLTVTVDPDPRIVQFGASPNSFLAGGSMMLTVNATGGLAPLTYAYSGLPAGCASENRASLNCSASHAGTFDVLVSVTDANGFEVNATTTVTVQPAFLGLPAVEGLALVTLVVVGAVVVGVLVLLIMRKRRSSDSLAAGLVRFTTAGGAAGSTAAGAVTTCASCGSPTPVGSKYCANCGMALESGRRSR